MRSLHWYRLTTVELEQLWEYLPFPLGDPVEVEAEAEAEAGA